MYRVILVGNGNYKKTLHRCKTKETAFVNYRKIKLENESVVFPRRYVNSNTIHPIKYEVYIIKEYEEGDKFRIRRDKFGRTYEEQLFGDWVVLDSAKYEVEETFWLYGKQPNDRIDINDIILMLNMGSHTKSTTQIIVVHNKLVIHSDEIFEMVICKCKKDAQRLHHKLYDICKKEEVTGYLFMGTASPATVSRMYEVIRENTTWPIEKIRRTTTRP